MYLFLFEPMPPLCFCAFRFLEPYADISGINYYMNSHLSVIQALEALEVYGSIGAKYIKFCIRDTFFIHSSMFI